MSGQKLKVLVLCDSQGGRDANVVRDYLYSFNRFSRHEFFYLHAWRSNQCQFLNNFDLDRFDVLLFFWDCHWLSVDDMTSPFYMPRAVIERIAASQALKVQFLQDEYRDVRKINRVSAALGINLMFTCVAEQDHEFFYPRGVIPSLQAVYTVLTGYVPDYLERVEYSAAEPRSVDIGYRSRAVPFYLGRVAQEKVQIAHEFTRIGHRYGFSTDISVREEDRIYGERWLDFLKSSRISLGTESGASVVDLDGEIRAKTQAYMNVNPHATFEEVEERFFADVDGQAVIQTISPRIFEAAAFQNTLVLHEGEYAGIIQPDVHFIAVKKDYSNEEEVVAQMRDKALCQRLAKRTHDDLIRSRRYNYRSFVRRFDEILLSHRKPSARANASRLLFYASTYVNQSRVVPRTGGFLVLPHPVDLVQAINGKRLGVHAALASVDAILALLASCTGLRQRILEALRHPDEPGNFTWTGAARDLRILAMLNFARTREVAIGPVFEVHVEYDPGENRLNLRSVLSQSQQRKAADPSDDEKRIFEYLRQEEVSIIAWDHGTVADSFILPGWWGRFFLVAINDRKPHRFDNVHGLFEKHQAQELGILQQVLYEPIKRNPLRQARVLAELCGSLAVGVLYRTPLRFLRKIMKRPGVTANRSAARELSA